MGQLLSSIRRDNTTVENTEAHDGETDGDESLPRFSKRNGPFFGTHFLMGGERYEVSKPEAFLFGENSDLDFLNGKPAEFPYVRQPITDPVKTLNALINLRRDSVKLVRVKEEDRENMEKGKEYFTVEFCFDCDSACYVQIHFFACEIIKNGKIGFAYQYPDLKPSPQYFFDIGAEQYFNQYVISQDLFTTFNVCSNEKTMHYESGSYFPVVIELHTVDCGVEQVQTTMASVNLSTDRSPTYVIKPLKQKLIADGVVYLLQEIYGIENKEHDLNDENGSECIICLSDIRDTVILPCRHLCICNACAETLRYRQNNCPICRSPFRALLQLKTMRVVSTVSIADQSLSAQQTRSQTRYETMTLVEALNGPISHIQSCITSTSPVADDDCTFDEVATNETDLPEMTNSGLSCDDDGADENAVYIEMKPAKEFAQRKKQLNESSDSSTSSSDFKLAVECVQSADVENDEKPETSKPDNVETTSKL